MTDQDTCTCNLKYKIRGLEQQIIDLEDQIDEYKQNLENAQYENTKLANKVDELATNLTNLKKELEAKHGEEQLKLQNLIKDLKSDKAKLKKDVESNLAILKDVHISMTRFDSRQLIQECQVMLGEPSTSNKVKMQKKMYTNCFI